MEARVKRESKNKYRPEIPGGFHGMTPTGFELPSDSTGKSQNAKARGAPHGAIDPDLAVIMSRWADLPADVRKMIVGVVRLTPKADASNAQGPGK